MPASDFIRCENKEVQSYVKMRTKLLPVTLLLVKTAGC